MCSRHDFGHLGNPDYPRTRYGTLHGKDVMFVRWQPDEPERIYYLGPPIERQPDRTTPEPCGHLMFGPDAVAHERDPYQT